MHICQEFIPWSNLPPRYYSMCTLSCQLILVFCLFSLEGSDLQEERMIKLQFIISLLIQKSITNCNMVKALSSSTICSQISQMEGTTVGLMDFSHTVYSLYQEKGTPPKATCQVYMASPPVGISRKPSILRTLFQWY